MTPTPIENTPQGVHVKREDYIDLIMPNGKLRGVLPYLRDLYDSGVHRIVNVGASHSNSHALVARAVQVLANEGRQMWLRCATNTWDLEKPNLAYAQHLGAVIQPFGPAHLGPLKKWAADMARDFDAQVLPWGLAGPPIIAGISEAVAEVPPGPWLHVTPFGAGSYTAAVYRGLAAAGRLAHQGGQESVVGVAAMGLRPSAVVRVRELAGIEGPLGHMALQGLALQEGRMPDRAHRPPWPCDSHYEWLAWPVAQDLVNSDLAGDVLLWSVGRSPW